MILRERVAREATLPGLMAAALLAAIAVPSWTLAAPTDPQAQLLSTVSHIDHAVTDMAGASKSVLGTGGMKSKLRAARLATAAGAAVIMANAAIPGILEQIFAADPGKIKVPALVIYTPTDLIFYAPYVEETAKKIAANGVPVETATLTGPNGHLNGVVAVSQAADKIKAFLGQ